MIAAVANGGLIFFNRRKSKKTPHLFVADGAAMPIIELRQVIKLKIDNDMFRNAAAPEFFSVVPTSPRARLANRPS
jgi:hypothetical protein